MTEVNNRWRAARRGALVVLVTALATLAFFAAASLFYRPALTHGNSMSPTLSDGDWGIASVMDYKAGRGDVVIIRDKNVEGKYIVKRVIGLAGDLIDIDFATGVVTRNGQALDEPYITESTRAAGDIEFPLVVTQRHVFVLGDNRNHSTDSRTAYTGLIAEENIEGRVIFRVYPFNKFGKIE